MKEFNLGLNLPRIHVWSTNIVSAMALLDSMPDKGFGRLDVFFIEFFVLIKHYCEHISMISLSFIAVLLNIMCFLFITEYYVTFLSVALYSHDLIIAVVLNIMSFLFFQMKHICCTPFRDCETNEIST